MAEHTPGPWTADGSWVFDSRDGIIVSPMLGYDGEPLDGVPARDEANARFIAAAPDMEKALQGIRGQYLYMSDEEFAADYPDVYAALAKARGE